MKRTPAAKRTRPRNAHDSQMLPSVTIIGTGNWGTSLALALNAAGVTVPEIVAHRKSRASSRIARGIGARSTTLEDAALASSVFWICTPDKTIAQVAIDLCRRLVSNSATLTRTRKAGPVVFHSSGALPARVLAALREVDAAIASVHPLMTFPDKSETGQHASQNILAGVPFGIEGDLRARRTAQRLIHAMHGMPFTIPERSKALYHAFGTFTSPLLVALLTAASHSVETAGWSRRQARLRMRPIVERTILNFFTADPAKSFSGPIARGDAATVALHLGALHPQPEISDVYRALSRYAASNLPSADPDSVCRTLSET